jgi:ATP-dependent DNA helicase RecQ
VSGTLVQNFSKRVSERLKIPVSDALKKVRATKEQKVFENNLLKSDNVKDVFIVDTPSIVTNKAILLIDDIYDSGATLKEAGKYLTKCGAKLVAPLVIAKTVGGTQD